MIKHFTLKKSKGFSFCAILVMAMMVSIIAKGQFPASNYTFTQTSGTYTQITGGTLLAPSIPNDGTYSVAFTPGFNFCGTVYTNAFVGDNGVITLGGTTAGNFTSAILNGGGSGILLCPFNADLIGSSAAGATPNIRYQLVGNEHVFQWNDVSRFPGATDRFSFQARLNHVTGTITYVYSATSVGTPTGNQPVIGIRTANTTGNWQNRMVANDATSSWATSVPGTVATSLCRFTSSATNPKQPVTGQTYIYTPPPPCNTATGLPTAGTTSVTPAVVCVSQNVTLSFTPATAMPITTGITYQWQSAPAVGGPWTNMGTPTTASTYTTTTPISTPLFFRAQVLCNATTVLFNAAPVQVLVSNPGTATVTNGTRCGPGVVNLAASTTAINGSIRWFSNLTNAVPLATTNTFTTPYLAQSTTYYAAAVTNATFQTYNAGLPAFVQNFQVIGVVPGLGLNFTVTNTCNIDSVGVYPIGTGTLSIAIWNATTQALVYTSPTSPVITGTGVEKRMIPVGATGLAPGDYIIGLAAFTGLTNLRNEGASPVAYPFTCPVLNITSGSTGFGSPASNLYLYCYDWKVSTIGGCEGPRVPVVATVTTPPAVTKTATEIACNDAITTISVASSPMSNYTTYSWTPVVTDLYTNATATTPYVSGSAPTVYMKSSVVGQHTYYMYATGATPAACAFADTVKIWVQPDSVYIKAGPDTICVSGTSMLKLIPQTGYAPNTIQWQESSDGTTYTDIPGATSVVYTTPTLTADHFYRALIKSVGSVPPCLSPVKKIVVANPQLISTTDSFNCGPGTVTLQATIGANSGVKWYESMTASQPVGTGSPWVTPYLGVTDTFYVAASSGTPQPDPANVVVAGSTGTIASYRLPLFHNKGHRFQWIITAAEMTAQGYTEGLVKSIGFDFAGVNMTYQNISLKMKLTTAPSFAVAGVPGTTFTIGMAQVYTAVSFTPTPNSINSFMLQAPFYWDGTSNIIIEMCHSNPTTGTLANSANLKYRYYDTYPNNLAIYQYGNVDNICSTPTGGTTIGPVSSYYRPHTIIGMAGPCESPRQAVIAHIRPVPVVDLGADTNKCVDAGYEEILDAGVQPNTPQFLWDNGSVNQTRAVSASGTYTVKVTNQYTCHGEDTINIILRPNPIVNLGNDTIVCNGVILTLDPGNVGAQYSWNTGQTTQSINTSIPGTFSVLVTSSQGCKKSDAIVVSMQGQLPTTQGINVTNDGQYTVHFSVINPLNVISYDWDFGDGSPHSNEASPMHTYPSDGDYTVVLRLSSSCGFLDEVLSAHILGINQLNVNKDELLVYPNPMKDAATILNHGALKMENITVYNILGQVIYKSKADSKDKHTLNLAGFASGVYTIQISTDKGTVARKLEIIK